MSAFRGLSQSWTSVLTTSPVLKQSQTSRPKAVLLLDSSDIIAPKHLGIRFFPQGQPSDLTLMGLCLLLIPLFLYLNNIHTCQLVTVPQAQAFFGCHIPLQPDSGLNDSLFLQHSFLSCLSFCLLLTFLSFCQEGHLHCLVQGTFPPQLQGLLPWCPESLILISHSGKQGLSRSPTGTFLLFLDHCYSDAFLTFLCMSSGSVHLLTFNWSSWSTSCPSFPCAVLHNNSINIYCHVLVKHIVCNKDASRIIQVHNLNLRTFLFCRKVRCRWTT